MADSVILNTPVLLLLFGGGLGLGGLGLGGGVRRLRPFGHDLGQLFIPPHLAGGAQLHVHRSSHIDCI